MARAQLTTRAAMPDFSLLRAIQPGRGHPIDDALIQAAPARNTDAGAGQIELGARKQHVSPRVHSSADGLRNGVVPACTASAESVEERE